MPPCPSAPASRMCRRRPGARSHPPALATPSREVRRTVLEHANHRGASFRTGVLLLLPKLRLWLNLQLHEGLPSLLCNLAALLVEGLEHGNGLRDGRLRILGVIDRRLVL